MHVRRTVAMLALTLAVAVGAVACGGGDNTANTGPSPTGVGTSTLPAIDTLPPLTLIPRTTTTTEKPTTTTTAPAKPKPGFPSTTKKPVVTTTAAPKPKPTFPPKPTTSTVPVVQKVFCDYSNSLDFKIMRTDWVQGFYELQDAVNAAQAIAPPEVAQSLADIKAVLDAARPAVDDGTMTSDADMSAWFAQQTPETQARIANALLTLKTYLSTHCK